MKNEFTADEVETILDLINDWGFEYSLNADRNKVADLKRKVEFLLKIIKAPS